MIVKMFLRLVLIFMTLVPTHSRAEPLEAKRTRSPLAQADLKNMADQFTGLKTYKDEQWKLHTKTDPRFSYRLEYPSSWSVQESGNTTFFLPSHARSTQESISVLVINYKETPPLPIQYTYRTVRKIQLEGEEILVRERQPSAINELYVAEINRGDYTIEFRFSLDRKYDDVFDHMISSLKFTS